MSNMKHEQVDVCVIGSGAGGAVIAFEAAKRGLSTLVLERGPYVRGREMSHDEFDMFTRLYKDGALQFTTSLDLFISQGSCVGGSTVLSNGVILRPDAAVLTHWQSLGASLDLAKLALSYDRVEAALGAAVPPAKNTSSTTRMFVEAARGLGLEPHWMKKALGHCVGCGHCNIGCVFDHKQSALTTYVPWAEEHGARVLADTTVERIRFEGGRARSVVGRTGPSREELVVDAKVVVVAGGAIGSSTILQKSGITKNVGTRLSFNAGSMITAEFPRPIDAFDGDQMTAYLQGDGFLIEPTHYPVMSAALTTPGWMGEHAKLMKKFRNLAYAGALVPTEASGRVVQSPFFGHEETRYRVTGGDMARLKRGLEMIARVFFAAGATRIVLPTHRLTTLQSPAELSVIGSAFHEAKELCFGSSHPMGGNPLSDDRDLGVVDGDFAVHGFDNLFVCDASVFPSALGVNPMATVMALSDYAAPRILARA
jgi:choline dehydrogenase-like flavoprotein